MATGINKYKNYNNKTTYNNQQSVLDVVKLKINEAKNYTGDHKRHE